LVSFTPISDKLQNYLVLESNIVTIDKRKRVLIIIDYMMDKKDQWHRITSSIVTVTAIVVSVMPTAFVYAQTTTTTQEAEESTTTRRSLVHHQHS
jgi:hypothetical protein